MNFSDYDAFEHNVRGTAKLNVAMFCARNTKGVSAKESSNSGRTKTQQVFATLTKILNKRIPAAELQNTDQDQQQEQPSLRVGLQIAQRFLELLFTALEGDLFPDSISWVPGGHAWKIVGLDPFLLNVLPLFTGGCSTQHFAEFVRLLNMWGFRQILTGPCASSFYNPLFRQGMGLLRSQMTPNVYYIENNVQSTTFPMGANKHQEHIEQVTQNIEKQQLFHLPKPPFTLADSGFSASFPNMHHGDTEFWYATS